MSELFPPIRAITHGPKHHWFGYYDKLQFDPAGRYALGMEVDFEGHSPRPDDVIKIGMIDLLDDDRWIELGQSRAWCWQQGCMLQWRPGSNTEIVWNDRAGDHFVCHILDVQTRKKRTLPRAIYTISPDGRTALCADFSRLNEMCPGYGYAGVPDPYRGVPAPQDAGILRMDMETGEHEPIITLADVVKIPSSHEDFSRAKHYFNHHLFNTDGTRFVFLHRWLFDDAGMFSTRMMTAAPDGSDLRVVDDHGYSSHFIWRDPTHILVWSHHPSHGRKFHLFEDGSPDVAIIGDGVVDANGHCSYMPDTDWILNDTYPDDNGDMQLYLYHVPTERKIKLGRFHSPAAYNPPVEDEEWRCDLHPRFSPDGRGVVIDSAHGGNGRQMYLLDVSGIVANRPIHLSARGKI